MDSGDPIASQAWAKELARRVVVRELSRVSFLHAMFVVWNTEVA